MCNLVYDFHLKVGYRRESLLRIKYQSIPKVVDVIVSKIIRESLAKNNLRFSRAEVRHSEQKDDIFSELPKSSLYVLCV